MRMFDSMRHIFRYIDIFSQKNNKGHLVYFILPGFSPEYAITHS